MLEPLPTENDAPETRIPLTLGDLSSPICQMASLISSSENWTTSYARSVHCSKKRVHFPSFPSSAKEILVEFINLLPNGRRVVKDKHRHHKDCGLYSTSCTYWLPCEKREVFEIISGGQCVFSSLGQHDLLLLENWEDLSPFLLEWFFLLIPEWSTFLSFHKWVNLTHEDCLLFGETSEMCFFSPVTSLFHSLHSLVV